jgi:hypothetical protein
MSVCHGGLDRNAARSTLGFGSKPTNLSVGLSPTPIARVSVSSQCHPGRSDFPSTDARLMGLSIS